VRPLCREERRSGWARDRAEQGPRREGMGSHRGGAPTKRRGTPGGEELWEGPLPLGEKSRGIPLWRGVRRRRWQHMFPCERGAEMGATVGWGPKAEPQGMGSLGRIWVHT
jgi:hypothetical protein